jgi:uncharacterized MAPEG superfamily protein
MTVDLWMLVYSAVLCAVIPYTAVAGLSRLPGGMAWGFGNRDTAFAVPPWMERVRRAHANMIENLVVFACLVLVAHVAGKADATTALGARLFFVGRVAHFGVYLAGIPLVRTLVFGIAVFGEILILARILA